MKTPGYKKSEFWFTLVSFVISGLFIFGVITEADTKDDLISVSTHVVESIILIGGQFAFFSRYLSERRAREKEENKVSKELEDYVGVDKQYKNININTASIGELIQLPHIGPVTAQKIVDYRNKHKFSNPEQLININGVGEQVFKEIKPYIIA
jgi:competence ComEA-like helix-hairpin-helix protein|tara:strand:+ start:26 stop:484 length:459 start_codon:yes stop_codon:yes gene_type:complete